MSSASRAVRRVFALGSGPWQTQDPFLFCVHHKDDYPKGYKGTMGPDPITHRGRDMGSDFSYKDGYSFYHGDIVPGFPQHPHRGFETVTFTLKGYIDHSDSMGATARYGFGDVQWMTAGAGIQHAEMFPLVDDENPNPAELFQIWLNLPARSKMVPPAFKMLWEPEIPKIVLPARDERGQPIAGSIGAEATVVSGYPIKLSATESSSVSRPPNPPPDSWASDPNSDVSIWTLKIKNGQSIALPPCASAQSNRTVYFYRAPDAGTQPDLLIADGASEAISFDAAQKLKNRQGAEIQRTDFWTGLRAVGGDVEVLVLQGRSIGEPVAQHGPFVMNTREEIMQAFADYRRTQFGGWPWDTPDPVHPIKQGRFALHADGKREEGPALSTSASASTAKM